MTGMIRYPVVKDNENTKCLKYSPSRFLRIYNNSEWVTLKNIIVKRKIVFLNINITWIINSLIFRRSTHLLRSHLDEA